MQFSDQGSSESMFEHEGDVTVVVNHSQSHKNPFITFLVILITDRHVQRGENTTSKIKLYHSS